jgi:hypothetical protein
MFSYAWRVGVLFLIRCLSHVLSKTPLRRLHRQGLTVGDLDMGSTSAAGWASKLGEIGEVDEAVSEGARGAALEAAVLSRRSTKPAWAATIEAALLSAAPRSSAAPAPHQTPLQCGPASTPNGNNNAVAASASRHRRSLQRRARMDPMSCDDAGVALLPGGTASAAEATSKAEATASAATIAPRPLSQQAPPKSYPIAPWTGRALVSEAAAAQLAGSSANISKGAPSIKSSLKDVRTTVVASTALLAAASLPKSARPSAVQPLRLAFRCRVRSNGSLKVSVEGVACRGDSAHHDVGLCFRGSEIRWTFERAVGMWEAAQEALTKSRVQRWLAENEEDADVAQGKATSADRADGRGWWSIDSCLPDDLRLGARLGRALAALQRTVLRLLALVQGLASTDSGH